jgi:hypothetical protein
MNNDEEIEGENGEYCECCGAWRAWEKEEPITPFIGPIESNRTALTPIKLPRD